MSRGFTQKLSYWFICSFSKLKFYYSGTNACIMLEGNEKNKLNLLFKSHFECVHGTGFGVQRRMTGILLCRSALSFSDTG